ASSLPYTLSLHDALPILLIAEETSWPRFTTGYGLVDVQTRTLTMFRELTRGGSNRVKMYAPGPSYRANHFIFDLSPVGSAAATRSEEHTSELQSPDHLVC